MNFSTPKFDSAVAEFKAFCPGHEQLFRFGQFYVTKRTVNDLMAQIEGELRNNIRFKFLPPEQLNNTINFFRTKLGVPITTVDVGAIIHMLDLIEIDGDMAPIRAMFVPSQNDRANAQRDFTALWATPDIPAAPLFSTSAATLGKAQAAFQLEKDRCFQVLRSFARKLLKKRGITNLPPTVIISNGTIGDAVPRETAPGMAPAIAPQQTIKYNSPAALDAAMVRMKAALDAGAYVHCGVLSGALHDRSTFPQPEHHVLVFAHDTVDGQSAFLFWDPDASDSSIASTTWGDGFGVLFGATGRLSTAFEPADLAAIDRNKTSATFGNHLNEKVRHCYQVYYLQTLPLAATIQIHAKLLDLPSRTTFDQMLHNTMALYASHDIEILEASREDFTTLDSADSSRFQTLFVGEAHAGEPTADLSEFHETLRSRGRDFGADPAPTDIVIAFVRNLVPANRGCHNHPLEMPGAVLSASLAGEWTLAHEIGHVLGLEHALDTDNLMFASTTAITALPPGLTDDNIATIIASPLTKV